MTVTAFALSILMFVAKGEPVMVAQAYPDRFSCEKTEGEFATKAQSDPLVVGWVFIGKPCEPITEANKI